MKREEKRREEDEDMDDERWLLKQVRLFAPLVNMVARVTVAHLHSAGHILESNNPDHVTPR